MKNTDCKWLPETVSLNDYNGDFEAYFNYLYSVFVRDLIKNQPIFKGLRVGARKHPEHNGKHEGFYHLTSKDYEKTGYESRIFDPRRSERLPWIKPIIENYGCNKTCCKKIEIWKERKNRIHILFEDEYYVIVLDERKNYYVVVTAYYIETEHNLQNLLRRYEKAKGALNRTP